ncbi:unnamed protein product [Rotaria magnacalcarata]
MCYLSLDTHERHVLSHIPLPTCTTKLLTCKTDVLFQIYKWQLRPIDANIERNDCTNLMINIRMYFDYTYY